MHLRLILPLSVLLLAACASVYHPLNANGGYSEVQIDRNVFRVTVQGNVRSRQQQTDEMALLRSAEVALANGYPYFTSSGASTGSALSLAATVVSIPATTATIVGYATYPDTAAVVHDASRIVADLGPRYRKP